MKKEAKFEDIFQQQLEDLYDAENQLVDALPKLIAESSSESLAGALQLHLDETKEQVTRLEAIFDRMGEEARARKCEGMQGLLSETETSVAELKKSPVLDLVIIASARRVEHYEMAAYSTACSLAEMLGQEEVLSLLEETLAEETSADQNLAELAESILNGDEEAPGPPEAIGDEATQQTKAAR
jgi:ferritin-like metal-binding protein YciE